MVEYVLRREQWIPRPIEEVFAFFADAGNLEAITPPWLGFRILTPTPIAMEVGARIEYRIRLRKLPVHWITEIRRWDPPIGFMDAELRGPYRLWEHTHEFQSINGGTRMTDVVRYALPFGLIGRLAHSWFVKSELEAIFDYRRDKVSALLG